MTPERIAELENWTEVGWRDYLAGAEALGVKALVGELLGALKAKEADCAAMRQALEAVKVQSSSTELGCILDAALRSGAGTKLLAEHAAQIRELDGRIGVLLENAKVARTRHAAELDRLREALKRYGRHDDDCNGRPPAQILRKNCTCGLDKALNPPAGEPKPGERE